MIKYLLIILYIPISWYHAITCRSQSLAKRYERLRKDCLKLLRLVKLDLEVEGLENLKDVEVASFISNHQGTLDPLFIVAACPIPLTFVSKIENKKMIFLSSWAKSIEVFYFDREDTSSPIHMIRETARFLKEKRSTLIFAEGTRSHGKAMNEMKAAAFKPAQIAKVPVVAVSLINSYDGMSEIKKSGRVKIVFNQPYMIEKAKVEDTARHVQQLIQADLDRSVIDSLN